MAEDLESPAEAEGTASDASEAEQFLRNMNEAFQQSITDFSPHGGDNGSGASGRAGGSGDIGRGTHGAVPTSRKRGLDGNRTARQSDKDHKKQKMWNEKGQGSRQVSTFYPPAPNQRPSE